jgi:hypothetical protein
LRLTYYVVLPFVEAPRGLLAEEAIEARAKDEAVRMGRRLAETKAGVVVFSRSGDPDLGEYEDAKILARFGRIPAEVE